MTSDTNFTMDVAKGSTVQGSRSLKGLKDPLTYKATKTDGTTPLQINGKTVYTVDTSAASSDPAPMIVHNSGKLLPT